MNSWTITIKIKIFSFLAIIVKSDNKKSEILKGKDNLISNKQNLRGLLDEFVHEESKKRALPRSNLFFFDKKPNEIVMPKIDFDNITNTQKKSMHLWIHLLDKYVQKATFNRLHLRDLENLEIKHVFLFILFYINYF